MKKFINIDIKFKRKHLREARKVARSLECEGEVTLFSDTALILFMGKVSEEWLKMLFNTVGKNSNVERISTYNYANGQAEYLRTEYPNELFAFGYGLNPDETMTEAI